MKPGSFKNKLWILALIVLLVFAFAFSLFARGGYHWHGGGWHRWYGPSWFGVYVGVPALEIGAVVDELPYGYSTVIIGGVPYYCFDSVYYRAMPDGYTVVPEPAVSPGQQAMPPAVPGSTPAPSLTPEKEGGTITINVPNSKGGFNPITLKKYRNGYLGPQGEYYEGNPTIEQLKALYGK